MGGQVKPYASVPRINWSHPLAKGLKFYAYDANGVIYGLVSGSVGKVGTGATPVTVKGNRYGRGISYPPTASTGNWAYLPLSNNVLTLSATLPYSTFCGTIYTGVPLAAYAITTINNNDDGETGIAWLPSSATQLAYFWNNGASSTSYNQLLSTNGTFQTWGMVTTGTTTATLYANGAVDQNVTGISATVYTLTGGTSARVIFNNGSASGSNPGHLPGGVNGFVPFFAAWSRTITAAEASLIHQDPFCLLIYPEDEMYAMVGAAAALDSLLGEPQRMVFI